jgi:type II secretory ATPase GspE/PulE/Tfp pilus assembly ATPase PilB-like protein
LKNIEDQFVTLGIPKEQARVPKMFYRGRGCKACGYTGYLGRIGIFEVLDMSEKLRKLVISPEFDLDKLRMTAREEGMVSMFEDGVRKVELGMTTVDEVFRAIQM